MTNKNNNTNNNSISNTNNNSISNTNNNSISNVKQTVLDIITIVENCLIIFILTFLGVFILENTIGRFLQKSPNYFVTILYLFIHLLLYFVIFLCIKYIIQTNPGISKLIDSNYTESSFIEGEFKYDLFFAVTIIELSPYLKEKMMEVKIF